VGFFSPFLEQFVFEVDVSFVSEVDCICSESEIFSVWIFL